MTTKLYLLITADCHVIEGFLTGGNSHDVTVAEELTAEVVGCYILADRGYDSDRYRTELESLGNTPVIPGIPNELQKCVFLGLVFAPKIILEKTLNINDILNFSSIIFEPNLCPKNPHFEVHWV